MLAVSLAPKKIDPGNFDFDKKPFLVCWETTSACDLACVHCRASAQPEPAPDELNFEESMRLVREVHGMGTPILVFTGGDPLKKKRLDDLIRYAKSLGLKTGAIPAVTPLLTETRIRELKEAGLDQIAFSLDAPNAADHDAFRKTPGVFAKTLESIKSANACGLATQVNSLINVHNSRQIDEFIALVESLPIVFWEVFFLVPVGRGADLNLLSAEKFDEAFAKIYMLQKRVRFVVKVTEAQHYRKYVFEQKLLERGIDPRAIDAGEIALPELLSRAEGPGGNIGLAPKGVNSGKGFLFVSSRGEVFPSGFLPLKAGDLRKNNLSDIYRNSPLLKELRDPALLKGKCGICPFKDFCGGSRSRAYAVTGDYLAEEPCCSYQPVPSASKR
jgi:radical SAM protein